MNCSRNQSEAQAQVHLVRDAGVDTHTNIVSHDPIAAWLDLMEVVEALRPEWAGQLETAATLPGGRAFRL